LNPAIFVLPIPLLAIDVVTPVTTTLDCNEPPDEVTVTTPAETGETSNPEPKLIVPAVPTIALSSLISIPVPDAITPNNALPSRAGSAPTKDPELRLVRFAPEPENDAAVIKPTVLILIVVETALDIPAVVAYPAVPDAVDTPAVIA